jgi:hypothetical protein
MTRRRLLDLAKRAGIRRRHRMTRFRLLDEQQFAEPARSPDSPPDADLPASYGRTRLILMDVEPYWLFAYWEITPDDRRAFNRYFSDTAGNEWVLRFYDLTGLPGSSPGDCEYFDLPVDPTAGNWYVNLWAGGKTYIAELGVRLGNGRFGPLCRSNSVQVPPAGPPPDAEPRWIQVSWPVEIVEEQANSRQSPGTKPAVGSSSRATPRPEASQTERGVADPGMRRTGVREPFEDAREIWNSATCCKPRAAACRPDASDHAMPPLPSPAERASMASESAGSFGLGWSRSQGPSRWKRRK